MQPLIVLDDVSYTYPAQGPSTTPALDHVSLRIAEGEYLAIVGANGSGKSTLARHLNALLIPDQGSVHVSGRNTREHDQHPEIRRAVGMVLQRPEDQLVATIVEHDVAFGPENLGLDPQEIRQRVEHALRAVGLWRERQRPPHLLSVGQMQRLALAGVLAMRPRCIVFDEVTAMLDPAGRRDARALMRALHDEGLTIITISHLMEEALDADRVIVLHKGAVVMEGDPRAVFTKAASLRDLGLDLPPVARLTERLRLRIPELPEDLITVPDLVEALNALPHADTGAVNHDSEGAGKAGRPLVEAHGLGHTYMRGTPFEQRALQDVDLTVRPNAVHGLIGATGSGKSTLLQHLNGLLRPQEGRLRVGDYWLEDPQTDIRAVRRMVGLLFQTPESQIFEQYVGDEIAYGPRLAGLRGDALRDRVRWAMDLVGLDFEGFKDRFTFALSGGEKRKVALASILALNPDILLLDEPTAGLDPGSRADVIGHLQDLQASGMALMLSSHQMEDIAELSHDVTVLDVGRVTLRGTVSEVFAQGETLRAQGLGQPTTTEIAEALRRRGWSLPSSIVKEDAFVEEVWRRVRREDE